MSKYTPSMEAASWILCELSTGSRCASALIFKNSCFFRDILKIDYDKLESPYDCFNMAILSYATIAFTKSRKLLRHKQVSMLQPLQVLESYLATLRLFTRIQSAFGTNRLV